MLHHDLTIQAPLPFRVGLHLPVRKRVQCRTRDLHQSLLVKLNRAQLGQPTTQHQSLIAPPQLLRHEASMEVVRPCCPFSLLLRVYPKQHV